MADLAATALRLVSHHPAVLGVELAGSRSRGTHEELSDWDFAVTTSDFAAVARDLPALLAPLHPLGQQWEPRGHFPVYQLLLPGPTKIEYLFLDHSQQAMPAPTPGPATLEAINTHFWDWIWWIATKASIARTELVEVHLRQLFGYLLRPIGLLEPPADIQAAIERFVDRRDQLERDYDITVSRALEEEVRAGIRQLGLRRSELALVYPACCRGGADIQGPSSRAAPRACDTPIRVIETAPIRPGGSSTPSCELRSPHGGDREIHLPRYAAEVCGGAGFVIRMELRHCRATNDLVGVIVSTHSHPCSRRSPLTLLEQSASERFLSDEASGSGVRTDPTLLERNGIAVVAREAPSMRRR